MSNQPDMPDWDDLQDLWQDTPEVDMSKLASHARFVWWRMRFNFAFELLACAGGLAFMIWDLWHAEGWIRILFDIFFILFCSGGLWAAFYVRRGAWGDPGETALSLVELQIKRAQSSIRYVQVNNWGCLAGVPIIVMTYLMVHQQGLITDEKSLVLNILMGIGIATFTLFPILSRPYVKSKRDLVGKLELMAEHLRQQDVD
ncbi:MAG: hypothetical protein HWE25_09155 [Alphaproteobacteria bacterium]|nr:hypothetical protein [Alphaproteobacteria bacterium]